MRIMLNNRQYGEIKLKLQSVVPRQYQFKTTKNNSYPKLIFRNASQKVYNYPSYKNSQLIIFIIHFRERKVNARKPN